MGVLDAALHVGKESVYGTPAALTRSFEAKADGHKRLHQYLESPGFRAGMETLGADRRRSVMVGAEGAIEVDLLTKGMSVLFEQMLGADVVVGAPVSGAFPHTHRSSPDGPAGKSLTVQMVRPPVAGTVAPFTYHGGKVKTWEIVQALDETAKLKLDLDYEDEDTSTPAGVPTYPSGAVPFGWHEFSLTANGAPVEVREFSVKGDNVLKTDRRLLRANALHREPLRAGLPTYEGSMQAEFVDLVLYNLFTAGTVFPVVAKWEGAVIGGAERFTVQLSLPACQFSGESPEVSLDDLPKQPLPFRVLDGVAEPAVTLLYKTTDAAL
jgi:hypothetical protein